MQLDLLIGLVLDWVNLGWVILGFKIFGSFVLRTFQVRMIFCLGYFRVGQVLVVDFLWSNQVWVRFSRHKFMGLTQN